MLNEFSVLKDVLAGESDNSAVVSCESVLAILDREGCQDLHKLASADYVFPEYLELEVNVAKIQAVKKSFVRKFWKVAGRKTMRDVARSRLEEVSDFLWTC